MDGDAGKREFESKPDSNKTNSIEQKSFKVAPLDSPQFTSYKRQNSSFCSSLAAICRM
jgi:hypothetical protein